jgi:hypothetical protein
LHLEEVMLHKEDQAEYVYCLLAALGDVQLLKDSVRVGASRNELQQLRQDEKQLDDVGGVILLLKI